MVKKIFTFGGYNPPHKGHIHLFQTGLEYADTIETIVGGRKKNFRLPKEIRAEALYKLIEENNLSKKVKILSLEKRIMEINPYKYWAFLSGSDLLNKIIDPKKPMKNTLKFILSFDRIIILQREDNLLRDNIRNIIINKVKLIEHPSQSAISSTLIRQSYRNNKLEDYLIPKSVQKIINPYTNCFKKE